MQLSINVGAKEVSEKLKSTYDSKIKQKKAGVYYVRSTWYQSVKINFKPLSEQNTSVSVSVAYTHRFQEALFFATLLLLYLPLIFGLPLLIGLAILPHIITKPLVQEVVSSITSSEGISEAQRLRQELANQAQSTQQLQSEVAQKQMSDAALAQKQHELAVAQQEKEELEAKLAEAEKNTSIVQNITYNIQDSAISGDITNKINGNDLE